MTIVSKRNRIFILIIILIVLLGAYVGVLKYNDYIANKEESDESIVITSLDSDSVTALQYTNNGEEFSFHKSDEEWLWAQDNTLPITQSYVENILSNACSLNAVRLLEDNLDNIATYGLDTPAFTVILTSSDGTQTTIYIGDKNSATSNYYCTVEGSTNVYTIDESLVSTLGYTLNEMVAFEEIPNMTSANITDISYTDTDTSLNFDYFASGNAGYDYSGSSLWFLNTKYGLSACDVTAISTLETNISSLTFDSLVKYNATQEDLSAYGLDSPIATLNIGYTTTYEETETQTDTSTEDTSSNTITLDNTFTLIIGNTDGSGNYYVTVNGMTGVYTMAAESVEYFTNLNSLNFTNKNAFNVQKDSINSIDITIEGTAYNILFNKTTSTDDDGNATTDYTYTVNGTEVDSDKLDAFYTSLQNLTAESVVDKESAASGNESMTIVFNRNTENYPTVAIDISTYDASFYQANLSGSETLLLNIQDIKELASTINSLIE